MTTIFPILLSAAIVFSVMVVLVKTLLERSKNGLALGALIGGIAVEIIFIRNFLAALETSTLIH